MLCSAVSLPACQLLTQSKPATWIPAVFLCDQLQSTNSRFMIPIGTPFCCLRPWLIHNSNWPSCMVGVNLRLWRYTRCTTWIWGHWHLHGISKNMVFANFIAPGLKTAIESCSLHPWNSQKQSNTCWKISGVLLCRSLASRLWICLTWVGATAVLADFGSLGSSFCAILCAWWGMAGAELLCGNDRPSKLRTEGSLRSPAYITCNLQTCNQQVMSLVAKCRQNV